jgi:hypothetical protein
MKDKNTRRLFKVLVAQPSCLLPMFTSTSWHLQFTRQRMGDIQGKRSGEEGGRNRGDDGPGGGAGGGQGERWGVGG